MKKQILLWFLMLGAPALFAQIREKVEKDPITGKNGVVDIFGTTLVPFEYDRIYVYDSFAVVQQDQRMGILDLKGKVLVPVTYRKANVYSEWKNQRLFGNIAVAREENGAEKWGLLDSRGKQILPLKYWKTGMLYPDLIVVKTAEDAPLQFLDRQGKLLFSRPGVTAIPCTDQVIQVETGEKQYVFIDKTGKLLLPEQIRNPLWTDGKSVICGMYRNKVLLTVQGDTIISGVYSDIQPASDGRFVMAHAEKGWALVEASGKVIIPFERAELKRTSFDPQSAWYRYRGPADNMVFENRGAVLLDSCRVISNFDKPFLEDVREKLPDQHYDRYFLVSKGKEQRKIGFFHIDGRPIIPPQYKELQYCTDKHPIKVCVFDSIKKHSCLYTAVDWNNNPVVPGFFHALYFTENPKMMFGAQANLNKWGFIHLDRPEKTPYIYQSLRRFYTGIIAGKNKDDTYSLFTAEGKAIFGGLRSVEAPERIHFLSFDAKGSGRLVAVGRMGDTPKEAWIGINEQGVAYFFEDMLPPEPNAKKLRPMFADVVYEVPKEKDARGARPGREEVVEVAPIVEPACPAPDRVPSFPGGQEALEKYMAANLREPALVREHGLYGVVEVQFVVEKDGDLSNFQMLKGLGKYWEEEVVRMLGAMPPWEPARKKGSVIRTWYKVRVPCELK